MAARHHFELFERTIPAGTRFYRIMAGHHVDPLGCVATPSRFCDPDLVQHGTARYKTLYLANAFETAFLEAFLRDNASRTENMYPISLTALRALKYAIVETRRPLVLADLTDGGAVSMRIPTDAGKARNQASGRKASGDLWEHPDRPDGIHYRSRLNDKECLALYCRCFEAAALRPIEHRPVLTLHLEMAAILEKYRLALI